MEIARSLSIQIDNLCQFLPQDKVVEFAAMTPVELLRSTERAVASAEMIEAHEDLKVKRREQKESRVKIDRDQEILSNLAGRQRLQEADVERMREREQIVKRVRYLEAARPFAQYREAKEHCDELRAKKHGAQEEQKRLEKEVEPAMRAVTDKKQYRNELANVLKERKEVLTKAEGKADKVDQKIGDVDGKAKALQAEMDAERRSGQKQKQEKIRYEGVMARIKRQMEEAPPEFDGLAFNEKIVSTRLVDR